MARKQKTDPARTKVVRAGLVGVNWDGKRISSSVYPMCEQFCHDLHYWLLRRIAHIVNVAKPGKDGWTHLVCWPGRGMFVVRIEDADM